MKIKDWEIFYFLLFSRRLTSLEKEVTELSKNDPIGYKSHPRTKLLESVFNSITKDVPNDPGHAKFNLGNTLDAHKYKSWRRVKNGLPTRYRLFFKYTSEHHKIIYAWLNDETTLRNAGSKTDVYEVFKRMLRRGEVPDSLEDLLNKSNSPH